MNGMSAKDRSPPLRSGPDVGPSPLESETVVTAVCHERSADAPHSAGNEVGR
jgi:hypothetical protein